MDDLRGRFRSLDGLPAPDLWPEVETRATASDPAAPVTPSLRWRGSPSRADRTPSSRWAPRPALVVALAVLLLVALLAALAAGGGFRPGPRPVTNVAPTAIASALAVAPSPRSTSPAPVTPAPCKIAQPTAVLAVPVALHGSDPGKVVFAGCAVWVQMGNGEGVHRIDLASSRDVGRVAMPGVPSAVASEIATDGQVVWALVNSDGSETLTRIDPSTNSVTARLPLVVNGELDFALADGTAWVSGATYVSVPGVGHVPDPTVFAVDLSTGSVTATVPLPVVVPPLNGQLLLGVAGGAVWMSEPEPGDEYWVYRVDIATHDVVNVSSAVRAALGSGDLRDCALSDAALFCYLRDGDLARIALDTGGVLDSTNIGPSLDPGAWLAADGASVWAMPTRSLPASQRTPSVYSEGYRLLEVDGRSGRVLQRIPIALLQPWSFRAAGGSFWAQTTANPLVRIEIPGG